jgi:hypothetical protein
MRRAYWNGVTATLVWFGLGVAGLGVVEPAGSLLTFLLLGGGIVFLTLQAYYLIGAGHIEIHFTLPAENYPWMARLWVLFLGLTTLLFGLLVGRSWGAGDVAPATLLWLVGLPAGGVVIMLITALRLRHLE